MSEEPQDQSISFGVLIERITASFDSLWIKKKNNLVLEPITSWNGDNQATWNDSGN